MKLCVDGSLQMADCGVLNARTVERMRGAAMGKTGNPPKVSDARGPGAFKELMQLEQVSTQIFYGQPEFLPGVLQVEGYAREVIGGVAGLAPEATALAERVQVRMDRAAAFRERLDGDEPPHVWAVIDEAVFRRTRDVNAMRDQIDHLLELSRRETVHLTIWKLGDGPGALQGGTFEVHEVPGGEAAVFFEHWPEDEIVATDQTRAGHYRSLVKTMVASADADAKSVLTEIRDSL